MEVTKRTYQKHKTEKKITVKHYLIPKHTISLHKEINQEGEVVGEFEISHILSPIYVQVTYNRKSTKFRSEIRECYLDIIPEIPVFDNFNEFEDYYFNEKNDLVRGLTRDSNYIKWIVEQEIRINPDFDISDLPEIYHSSKYQLESFVEYCLNGYVQWELSHKIMSVIKNGADSSKYDNRYVNPKVSALQNLEYFINLYPELKLSNLKDKYGSQIWFLNLYLEESITNYDFDMEIQGNDEYRYLVHLPTSITVFDYLANIFKRKFFSKNFFITTEIQESLCEDIDILFAEDFADYDFGSFLDKNSFFHKIPLKMKDYNKDANH